MDVFERLDNNYYNVPIINIDDEEGHTGHIGFIKESQAFQNDNNIGYGIDKYQRPLLLY